MSVHRISAEAPKVNIDVRADDFIDNEEEDDDGLDNLSEDLNLISPPTVEKTGMTYQEKRNVGFMFLVYMVHAVPLGFCWATMPVLLREKLNYSQVATFLISQYPYSIKVLWSPVVEACTLPGVGRRKSWIIPCFLLLAVATFWLGLAQDTMVERIVAGETWAMAQLVLTWLLIMWTCSCIRIALDSWSLDLLSPGNVHWASTAMSVGESTAIFIAFNLFLGLSSYNPAAKTATDTAAVDTTISTENTTPSTQSFFILWAVIFVILALALLILKREPDANAKHRSLGSSYKVILSILAIPHIWTLFGVHMVSMIGFQTNDAIAILQLVKYKFSDRDIALLATCTFPFETAAGVLMSKAFRQHHPLKVWRRLFPGRLLIALVMQMCILYIAKFPGSRHKILVVLLPAIISRVLETTMFIALVAFHVQIADPRFGGTYIALLATTLNLRYDTLGFLYTKVVGWIDGGNDLTQPTTLIDGYQILNLVTVVLAIPVFVWFIRPATKSLQIVEASKWRISGAQENDEILEYHMISVRDPDERGTH